jgi:hypothetical protein
MNVFTYLGTDLVFLAQKIPFCLEGGRHLWCCGEPLRTQSIPNLVLGNKSILRLLLVARYGLCLFYMPTAPRALAQVMSQ